MADIALQYVVNQRDARPTGLRIYEDGLVQRPAPDNPLPGPTERLDRDRPITWQDDRHLSAEQLQSLYAAIRKANFADLVSPMLINYCKDDPGAAIWDVMLDGQHCRVLVYDPRPRRSQALDDLLAALTELVGR
jgi:hypothetical protein